MPINLTIRGHGVALTPALSGYVDQKLEPGLRRATDVVTCTVWLVHEPHAAKDARHTVRVSFQAGSHRVMIEKTMGNMYTSIDAAMGALVNAIERRRRLPGGRTRVRVYGRSGSSHAHA